MKIDYVIVSTDNNPLYSEFWEPVKKLWFKLIGIKPLLVKISDNNDVYESDDCVIRNIKKVEGIDTGFQSQIARMYVTKYYEDKVCLTSDIDMLPLSKKYFTDDITEFDSDSLIIFSSDAYQGVERYPICYNAAKGKLFNEIMNFEDSFELYCQKLHKMGLGWDTDELYFGNKVNTFTNQNKIIKLNRGWNLTTANNRIDRSNWLYDVKMLQNGEYIDSHSLRPYTKYKSKIDKIVNYLV
jgi:hypothetical protein